MGNLPPSVLRQPPPPPHHHHRLLLAGDKEGKTEMVEKNCVSVNRSTCPYYLRRSKRKRLTNVESLPEDMVFKILLHLSAQDIYDPARLVCRKWYHMIHTHNFIYAHLQHSTCGLLFQHVVPYHPIFIAIRQGSIETSKFNYKFRCTVWASCNGLILEYEAKNRYALYVANPETKQHFVLPPFFRTIEHYKSSGIAYSAVSMEYKVVLTYNPDNKSNVRECAILTVGVDNSWRKVHIEHLSLTSKRVFVGYPLITQGFMHWVGGTQVLTLDVETEIIRETPVPLPHVYRVDKEMYYMSTGRYLSLLIAWGNFLWEVWQMKPETGEWTKLPNIDLEAHKRFGCKDDEILVPVGWLEYPEVLLFGFDSIAGVQTCILYKFHTREIDSIDLPTYNPNFRFVVHRNSLVWLGGC